MNNKFEEQKFKTGNIPWNKDLASVKNINVTGFKGKMLYNPADPFGKIKEIRDKEGFKHNPLQWLRDVTTKEEYRFNGFKNGQIYYYQYQPKYKDILSFYDRKPLIIFLKNIDGTHFFGFNIHFIPMKLRERIFKEFEQTNGDKKISSEKVWTQLPTIQRLYPFILRMYLRNRVQETIYSIPQRLLDYKNVALFPTEKFFKKSSDEIFRLAVMNYRKRK